MVVKKKPTKHKPKVSQNLKGKPAAKQNGLTRRQLLKYGLAGGLGLAVAGAGYQWWPRGKQHTMIVVVIDTLRRDALSCYGNPFTVSPRIDSIAFTPSVAMTNSAKMPGADDELEK